MTVFFRLLEAGAVPPAGGPVREEWLLERGCRALQTATEARDDIARALRLGPLPTERFFDEFIIDPVAMEATRRDWDRIRSELDPIELTNQEQPLAEAIKLAQSALNYLEDSEFSDDAHVLIHRLARLRAGLYGCQLWVEKGEVWTDCPVRISHMRWGFSVEMTTTWNCSICDTRFDSCLHDPDTYYQVTIGRKSGICTGCFESDCDHEIGETYLVKPRPVANSISDGAVAVVERPRYPDARAVRETLPIEPGSEAFELATQGALFCELCLSPCPGWTPMPSPFEEE
ncbi:hypothetical protein ITJ64_18690 [Herbiconiux sp. VKM Ac-1786]|uniref:hypothetical protein n=1 Tax=Herbiconiux sp. VKM Ac-1786 TaxID=2783824 RepID=UPI00188AE039|nr:hypothetical protein [Herbiconiux sp. VKM Ac-1786]MBF4574544.1 hypothetical protein [Herbiconiux sp. VKM Ac-1786]